MYLNLSHNFDDMRKAILVLSLVALVSTVFNFNVHGQGYATKPYAALELYGGVGTTHFFGDLGGESGKIRGFGGVIDHWGIDIDQTRGGGLIGFRWIVNKTFGFSAHLSPMMVASNDINSKNEDRGYSSFAYLMEGAINAQMFVANRLTGSAPYLTAGVGGLGYNSKASWMTGAKWSGLKFGADIIMGGGVRFPLTKKTSQSIEVTYHYCFQDDVDRFGDSRIGDAFFMITYQVNLDLDKVFVYDHKGRVRSSSLFKRR
jgi:hypothetical protein